jgi:hypothetical protein
MCLSLSQQRGASNDHATVVSRIDIVRAITPGETYQTLHFVRPGAEILLRLSGWPKVDRVFAAIDAVEALGINPADAAPNHWRHVHNRLDTGSEPHPYSRDQIAPGSCGGACCHDALRLRHDDVFCDAELHLRGDFPGLAAVHLERQRQRPDRTLRNPSGRRFARYLTGGAPAARGARGLPRRATLSAQGRAKC